MKNILHMIQSRFGQITPAKLSAHIIIVTSFLIVTIAVAFIYTQLSVEWRMGMIASLGLLLVAYAVIRFRKRVRRLHVKIPLQKSDEKYVAIDKPTTAEIPISPISAEKAYTTPTHTAYRPVRDANLPKPLHLDEVELTQFARRRIAEEDNLDVSKGSFELRKSAKVLFFQFPKRIPSVVKVGETKDPETGQLKAATRTIRPPRSTIYGEVLFVLASLMILISPLLLSASTLPEWAVPLSTAIKNSEVIALIVLAAGSALALCAIFLFYRKWAYWRFWRLILLPPSPQTGRYGYLVVVDKPPLLGGGAPLIDLRKVNTCYLSTGTSERDEKGLSGMWMNILRIRWMIVDIPGDKDAHVNLMGPLKLREAAPAADAVKKLSAAIHTKDYE